jgi:isoleucyl-tRNA synthetase
VYPALHAFCASDLSAFYFDIRKDALYCDRPDSRRRRAARTVLDHLHRCLTTWLAPVLVFTAEQAWTARFGEQTSVHLQDFVEIPSNWRNDALAPKWQRIREIRSRITIGIEDARRTGGLKSSLQAAVVLPLHPDEMQLLSPAEWEEIAIVSAVTLIPDLHGRLGAFAAPVPEEAAVEISAAAGQKCARCWRVLTEVGSAAAHSALCLRCVDAVEPGLRPAA